MRLWSGRRLRPRDSVLLGAVVALFVLWLLPWALTTEISLALNMVVGIVILGWLAWAMITRRIGLLHWVPSQPVGKRAATRRARLEAMAQQQRLGAALSHGPYRAETAEAPASDERARARQELLEAIERHGGLSPQARAAAERAKRHRG
jgi:hypothetical protein